MYVFSGDYYTRSYLMIILVFSCCYYSVFGTDTKDIMPKITKMDLGHQASPEVAERSQTARKRIRYLAVFACLMDTFELINLFP